MKFGVRRADRAAESGIERIEVSKVKFAILLELQDGQGAEWQAAL